jgi:hypothetical protein
MQLLTWLRRARPRGRSSIRVGPMKGKRTLFVQRLHLGLGADYALRLVRLATDLFAGDMLLGLVFMAAVRASSQQFRNAATHHPGDLAEPVPTKARRPISVSALARSLGIPVGTTRRHVLKLTAMGFAERTEGGGVLVTSEILDREELRLAAMANAANMDQLIEGLLKTPKES